ncbi:PD-(D/E)XK nuclease-like domain-containing protein [Phytohalomonas tamaricis]|uniref:PD-(D/E)XK nuclease-like domain-containing protein n=1 Tax=Phytohalomonas tamaricis TaxID=2081032 RepID=UPI0021D462EE|nr:PD-(D/E)XK nuclease-like domain-containing protein [Phytohalomonas tamaricis]
MQPEIIEPGYYRDISNERYHASSAVSKSQLDLLHKSPALLQWSRHAPEDEEKKTALNIGDACHALILEPERFGLEYAIGPDAPKNTKAGKDAWAAFEETLDDRTALTFAEGKKVNLIRESVMAHPLARQLIEAEGDVEASIYWREVSTGQDARCRPDKTLSKYGWIVDLKTTADIQKFSKSVYEYRYHVQDAFYSDGYTEHFGEQPRGFLFIAFSTSIECGKYPVRIFKLDDEAKEMGRSDYLQDMAVYAECMASESWPGIETLSLPWWAKEHRA